MTDYIFATRTAFDALSLAELLAIREADVRPELRERLAEEIFEYRFPFNAYMRRLHARLQKVETELRLVKRMLAQHRHLADGTVVCALEETP